MAGQLVNRSHTWEKFASGVTLFMLGFAKKILLADRIGRPEMRVLMEIDLVQTTLGIKNPSNQPFSIRGMSGMTIMN